MSRHLKTLFFILTLFFFSLYLNLPGGFEKSVNILNKNFQIKLPQPSLNFKVGQSTFARDLQFKLGLDLQGGTQVTLEADMSQLPSERRQTALESVKSVISRRVDLYGVSESVVKTSISGDSYRLIVELPGVDNPQQALALIGKTASLEFGQPIYAPVASAGAEPTLVDFGVTDLTGADLESATVTFDTQDRKPAVSLQFKSRGAEKFADLTRDFINKPVAIMLDGQVISAPIVQSEILNGQAIISGNFALEEAKFLATQLNAGALPVPVKVLSQQNIAATLGAASVNQSLRAGLIGLAIVAGFMILYYKGMGFVSVFGLVFYTLLSMTIYKLIPITLTLPGIAGFILSVGMAVDSNILIFERFKEELRAGRPQNIALEMAFGRAWDSIKDANLATIITGLVLFNPLNWDFLNTSGSVRGFALTLLIGILVSLFTGIVVTRTVMRFFYQSARPKNV